MKDLQPMGVDPLPQKGSKIGFAYIAQKDHGERTREKQADRSERSVESGIRKAHTAQPKRQHKGIDGVDHKAL